MRLIDADALKKAIPNTHVDIFENCRNCRLLDDEQVKQLIDDTPTIELLKEQEQNRIEIAHEMVSNSILMYQGEELVRCKDCIHRGKSEKCVLAAISDEKGFPIFMLDNRGEWFCADGERK